MFLVKLFCDYGFLEVVEINVMILGVFCNVVVMKLVIVVD